MTKSAVVYSLVLHTGLLGGVHYISHTVQHTVHHPLWDAIPVTMVWEESPPKKERKNPESVVVSSAGISTEKPQQQFMQEEEKKTRERFSRKKVQVAQNHIEKKMSSCVQVESLPISQPIQKRGGDFRADPHNTMPAYPASARDLGVEGNATFRLTLTEDGRVIDIQCLTKDFLKDFVNAARTALYSWRFYGKCPPTVDVPICFVLEE